MAESRKLAAILAADVVGFSRLTGADEDYAWLMIEALRRLGFASRFVSGYLYDAALDGGAAGMIGSGATDAWVQVFLPGAG